MPSRHFDYEQAILPHQRPEGHLLEGKVGAEEIHNYSPFRLIRRGEYLFEVAFRVLLDPRLDLGMLPRGEFQMLDQQVLSRSHVECLLAGVRGSAAAICREM